ncbi:MAG TPA: hypothetical protein ACFCUY_01115 [Xenococcaceae cyanobacterium]|jgi:hypothetical protein
MMKNSKIWQRVISKTGVWLAFEIWLNLIGLDNIADYSEFIFAQDLDLRVKNRKIVKIAEYPPQFCPQIADFCPIPGSTTKPTDLEEASSQAKAEIFKNKCQQLANPCLKIVCLTSFDSQVSFN